MTAIDRRSVLGGVAALTGSGGFLGACQAATELKHAPCGSGARVEDAPPLAILAAQQNRFFGCAVKDPLFTDEPFQSLVVQQCNLLVCVYSMKWKHLEPEPGRFDFWHSDRYVDFAERHGMQFRGHTLVWESSTPPWLADELDSGGFASLQRHIQGVAGHYAGRMRSWDVVNEAVWPSDGRPDRLKNNVFLQALGPSYIDAAFEMAREADPAALLYYNSNPAPYGREWDRPHFEGVIDLLEGLVARGIPVQGLGLQGHLSAARDETFDEEILVWFFEQATALGLEILITEMDVHDKGLPPDVALRERKVAHTYRRFLDVALAFPAVKGVLTWGLSDRFSELNRWPREDGWAVRGLPYGHCLEPKVARQAIAEAFQAHPTDRA